MNNQHTKHAARQIAKHETPRLDHLVLMIAIIAPFTNIPQILKIYVEGSGDASLVSWLLYTLCSLPLMIYGIIHREKVIMFNAGLNSVMQAIVSIGIIMYS